MTFSIQNSSKYLKNKLGFCSEIKNVCSSFKIFNRKPLINLLRHHKFLGCFIFNKENRIRTIQKKLGVLEN